MKITNLKPFLLGSLLLLPFALFGQTVDYSVVSVPEESGLELVKITADNDQVAMPLVRRTRTGINWTTGKIVQISPEGDRLAFISARSNTSNVFVKDIDRQGSSIQRTSRTAVNDFSFSPDGQYILFSEAMGRTSQIFLTDASQGFVCRQITSGGQDYSPIYVPDMSKIFFSRQETRGFSLWSYDVKDNFLSSYSAGLNPCMLDGNTALCTRMNAEGRGEIWKIDFSTGIEECIVSDLNISFSTPSVSPDGRWLVFTGGSHLDNAGRTYWNTDIYLCRMDGTGLMQLTYHAADDLSPAWSKDGRYIYFISQRGSADAIANIWRITCPVR